MKKMMAEDMFAQDLCTEDFSEEELEEAKSFLVDNQNIFFSRDPIGYRLRENAIDAWKKTLVADGRRQESELQDNDVVKIIADLEDAEDIRWAMDINEEDVLNGIESWHC